MPAGANAQRLAFSNVQEVVEVSAQASLVDANTSSVGKLIDNRRIAELPLNTRNVYSLIFLTPGVSGMIGNAYGDLRYTINGARPRTSDTLVDGVTATFPTVTGGVGISVFPSVDAIQEFKVLGSTYPAEFGRSLGSVINVVYKSGSNELRGSAYEFLRDSAFDSRDFSQSNRRAWAWSKAIEEGESHQNSYDIRASRSVASYDIPHRLVLSALYEVPFGKGRRFGAPAVVDAVLGGWQINGIVTVQSGTPLTISASNTAGLFNPVTRANWNGQDPRLDGPREDRLTRWFDTTVFSQPPAFSFGNAGATFPLLRTDRVRNLDLSLFKHFELRGRMRLQARVEAFNALNRVQFGSPNTSVTSSSFGLVNIQANTPRQLQFGVKMLW